MRFFFPFLRVLFIIEDNHVQKKPNVHIKKKAYNQTSKQPEQSSIEICKSLKMGGIYQEVLRHDRINQSEGRHRE